jgi:hypothetical protein
VPELVGIDDRPDRLHGAVGNLEREHADDRAVSIHELGSRLSIDLDLLDLHPEPLGDSFSSTIRNATASESAISVDAAASVAWSSIKGSGNQGPK